MSEKLQVTNMVQCLDAVRWLAKRCPVSCRHGTARNTEHELYSSYTWRVTEAKGARYGHSFTPEGEHKNLKPGFRALLQPTLGPKSPPHSPVSLQLPLADISLPGSVWTPTPRLQNWGGGRRNSHRPDALMARVAAEWPSSREWMKTSVIFSPPMKVSCQEERGGVVIR